MPRFTECWRCGNSSATVACPSCNVAKYCSKKCKDDDITRHNDAECRPVSILKTCSSCFKIGSSLQRCTGCYRAFYCDAKCQKNNRKKHKVECKRIISKIDSLAQKLHLEFLPKYGRICAAHYYWGNAPAYDYLNLLENEGVEYDSDMNVLVLGVGDLRNIVLTCASLPESFTSKVKFVLNDVDRWVLARQVLLLYMMLKSRSLQGQFPSTGESRPFLAHYYWGNVPAYDYLNLLENEGVEYDSNMNVLVLGVGDLRNIVLTCASLPKSFTNKVKFVLNDSDSCVLSRLVLLMYMIIKCDLSVCKVVTEIWYSLSLSEKTYDYLFSSLQGLLRLKSAGDLKAATGELIEVHESHFKEFQEIWRHWLELRVEGTSDIQKQRQEAFSKDPSSFRGKRCYYNCIPKEHLPSAKKFMEDGIFKRTKRCSFAENPTLTGASFSSKDEPFKYCCLTSVLPFTGWDYVDVAKMMYESSVVIMYGNYIEFMLCSFMEILKSKQVTFEIILGNCMDIDAFLNKEEKYDRISTSNLMDYILLPNLMR
ncbi:uncharacterized protein LOC114545187 [Dendronephthya gigantea]|uniref:uncharacterized protein LOC114545187 n=1 Tax=Dendronephthya gigantea TaxID=151771 RepID=UPI00106D14CE|nr:uncharacterized protein LOC114545187 [Dendronephthya gigantea]